MVQANYVINPDVELDDGSENYHVLYLRSIKGRYIDQFGPTTSRTTTPSTNIPVICKYLGYVVS